MEETKTIAFLDKIIEKTKAQKLKWSSLNTIKNGVQVCTNSNMHFSSYSPTTNTCQLFDVNILLSYRTEYNNGFIYVVIEQRSDDEHIILFVRPSVSDGIVVICEDFGNDVEVSSRLRRLYTLIRSKANEIETFVNKFLGD